MNPRSLTSSVVIFVCLMVAGLGMAALGLRLPDPQAGPALILTGTVIAAAALADFLLGLGSGLSLPSRAVLFVALTAAGFVLAEISLRIGEPAAPRLLVPLGAGPFGAALVYFLSGRRAPAQ